MRMSGGNLEVSEKYDNMKRVFSFMPIALLGALLSFGDLSADEMTFVAGGKPSAVRHSGKPWEPADSGLQCGGEHDYLVASHVPGAGDFHIRVRISLERLDGTAASLVIGQNHFGFDGRDKRLCRSRLVGSRIAQVVCGNRGRSFREGQVHVRS